MSFAKTENGRAALRNRASGLSAIERQILIVSNGVRGEQELSVLMCRPVGDEIDRLIALGYLARTDRLARPQHSPTGSRRSPEHRPTSSRTGSRPAATRSLAATKMYVMGLLSLQRTPEAVELSVALHTADSHDEFLQGVVHCVGVLNDMNGSSYARQVARMLGRLIPEAHVPGFVARLRATTLPEVVGAFIDEASHTMPLGEVAQGEPVAVGG